MAIVRIPDANRTLREIAEITKGGGIKFQIEAELHPRQRRVAINGSASHSSSIEKWYPNASRKLRTVLNRGTFG